MTSHPVGIRAGQWSASGARDHPVLGGTRDILEKCLFMAFWDSGVSDTAGKGPRKRQAREMRTRDMKRWEKMGNGFPVV